MPQPKSLNLLQNRIYLRKISPHRLLEHVRKSILSHRFVGGERNQLIHRFAYGCIRLRLLRKYLLPCSLHRKLGNLCQTSNPRPRLSIPRISYRNECLAYQNRSISSRPRRSCEALDRCRGLLHFGTNGESIPQTYSGYLLAPRTTFRSRFA